MFYFYLSITLFIYLIGIKGSVKYNKIILHCSFFLLLLLSVSNVDSFFIKNTLASFIFTLISIDFTISVFFKNEYGGRFNYSFALSIVETTKNEAKGMIKIYRKYVLFFLGFLLLCFLVVNSRSYYFNMSFLFLIPIWVSFFIVKEYFHAKKKNNIESKIVRILNYFPFSNFSPFIQVLIDRRKISIISKIIPEYNFSVKENGNDLFILIIGESARPDNMSVYGYQRETTPNLDKEKIFLFKNAYSPTPITATSVPISLTKATVNNLNVNDYSDNVVNIANSIGLKTYWFSNQGMYGDHSNAITGIAMNCNEKKWVSGYDEKLLPLLDNALNDKSARKKFIVLHLYGSHVPCNERYPDKYSFFNSGTEDDYYDNSIRYTDHIIFEVLNRIRKMKGSLIYFSDHGLERVKTNNKVHYKHGGVNASLSAFKVPMFIYNLLPFSNVDLNNENIWLTENNYQLIKKWFGIDEDLSNIFEAKEINVMDTTGKIKKLNNCDYIE